MPKDGTAILLNFLPTRIIIVSLSSTDSEIVFKSGARTTPRKSDPPTQIEAEIRCAQVMRASTIGIADLSSIMNIIYSHSGRVF